MLFNWFKLNIITRDSQSFLHWSIKVTFVAYVVVATSIRMLHIITVKDQTVLPVVIMDPKIGLAVRTMPSGRKKCCMFQLSLFVLWRGMLCTSQEKRKRWKKHMSRVAQLFTVLQGIWSQSEEATKVLQLSKLLKLCKHNGTLVLRSTCSIDHYSGSDSVDRFLSAMDELMKVEDKERQVQIFFHNFKGFITERWKTSWPRVPRSCISSGVIIILKTLCHLYCSLWRIFHKHLTWLSWRKDFSRMLTMSKFIFITLARFQTRNITILTKWWGKRKQNSRHGMLNKSEETGFSISKRNC